MTVTIEPLCIGSLEGPRVYIVIRQIGHHKDVETCPDEVTTEEQAREYAAKVWRVRPKDVKVAEAQVVPVEGEDMNNPTTRFLYCPICGCSVEVTVSTELPEVYRIPEHPPWGNANPYVGAPANLCSGVVVTVRLDFDKCKNCGQRMSKHPSGLCLSCVAEEKTCQE